MAVMKYADLPSYVFDHANLFPVWAQFIFINPTTRLRLHVQRLKHEHHTDDKWEGMYEVSTGQWFKLRQIYVDVMVARIQLKGYGK